MTVLSDPATQPESHAVPYGFVRANKFILTDAIQTKYNGGRPPVPRLYSIEAQGVIELSQTIGVPVVYPH